MSEWVQVKGTIPKDLKRKAFAAFALQDEKFNRWLLRELTLFVQENEVQEKLHPPPPELVGAAQEQPG